MQVDQANVNNLKSLWEKYGSQLLKLDKNIIKINTHWPYRCWFDDVMSLIDFSCLNKLPESTVFPVWGKLSNEKNTEHEFAELSLIDKQFEKNNWFCLFEQTAMYLALTNGSFNIIEHQVQLRIGFAIKKVETPKELTLWVDIVTESFGYSIDRVVIEKLIYDQDMQILMAYYNDEAIATAVLHKTSDIIGVHQVGVKKKFQSKGFARILMQRIIAASLLWQGKYIVLQASPSGKPLYESLGFKSQFLIKNYKKNVD